MCVFSIVRYVLCGSIYKVCDKRIIIKCFINHSQFTIDHSPINLSMQRTRNILFNCALFFNCLLLFLLLFYDRILVPSWIQVLGRMHPLIVHFPIVLLLIYIVWQLVFARKFQTEQSKSIAEILLLTAAFSAAVTALFGLLLSKEEGYDPDALAFHKYTGVSLSFLSFLWCILIKKFDKVKLANAIMSLAVFALLLIAGDLGAGITHGENYLLAPIIPKAQPREVALEDAVVYTDMVQPILQSKCIGCHNNKKAKGELIMETPEQLLKGGKDGMLWDSTNVDVSLLLKRIHLPEEDEKHMPPQGKPQLSQEEMNIIYYWLKAGSNFTTKVTDLPATDTLRMMALAIFKPNLEEKYDFAAADESAIQQLSNNNRVIVPLALNSPALSVDFYNSENYSSQSLKDLLKLKEQIVSINLAHMPATDDDVATLAQFINLRKVNLNFTKVTGKQLAQLSKLANLKELSLSGTAVNLADLDALKSYPKLKDVYVWNTSITDEAAKNIKASYKIQTGFYSDTVIMKLTPPVLQNENQIFTSSVPLQLKHYINGTTIRYTLDGKDPDSINSPVYDNKTIIDTTALVKAKAFKKGWISSDVLDAWFYKSTYTPDSIYLASEGDYLYKADGAKSLIDHDKGQLTSRTFKWIGFQGKEMVATMWFDKPVKAKTVSVSTLIDIDAYIMPAQSIEVWGGADSNHLKLLSRITPQQPSKTEPAYLRGYDCTFPPTEVKYIRVKASAVKSLPSWHRGKGDKGWFFIDEIFVN